MSATPLRVVLDCDTANEIDDQFAIAYALGSPALDVRGVVSVHNTYIHGAASVERYQAEAERVVGLCGARDRVPCLRGAIGPMETRATPVPSAGLDFLIAEAEAGPLTIIATGPITDIASLLLVAPHLRERIRVVWLGGFPDAATFRRYRMAELNGRADIAAWRVLFETDVPLLQLPGWPGVATFAVEYAPYAAALRALGRPIAGYLADLLVSWQAHYPEGDDRTKRKVLWDAVNVAALVLPEAVTIETRPAPLLDAASAHDFSYPGRPIDLLIDLDAPAIFANMTAALKRLPESA